VRKNRKGFTLIELVIVIAILGILALYAVPKYQGLIEEARSAEARAQIGSFRSALAIYYAKNHGMYPTYDIVNGGTIFAEEVVPEVEVTLLSGGTVKRSNILTSAGTKDGKIEAGEINDGGGWVYDDGSGLTPAYSKADVRINSKGTDTVPDPDKYWYQY